MPLRPGQPVGKTIDELEHHGSKKHSLKQEIAIGYAVKRRGKKRHKRSKKSRKHSR